MKTAHDKIEQAKAEAAASLAREIARIEWDAELRTIAPDGPAIVSTGRHEYNNADCIRYAAKNAAEVSAIIMAWRDKYGAFLPIGQYSKGCTTITAYPYKEYVEPDALKAIEDDAVMAQNRKGRGFSSVEFSFYPTVSGRRILVEIDMEFRCHIPGFEGYINAHYDRYGNVCRNVEKRQPAAFSGAAYVARFGGGSEDSADWRGVFNCDALLTALEG